MSPQALPYVLPGCGPINIIKRIDEVEKYQRLIKEDLVWLNGEKNYDMCPLKQTGHMSIMQRLEDLERSSREYKDEYFKLREEKVSAGFNIMTGIGGAHYVLHNILGIGHLISIKAFSVLIGKQS